MNDVEKIFHEDLIRGCFSEAVADDVFDFVDSMENEADDTDSESEEI